MRKYDIEMDLMWDGKVVDWIHPVRDRGNWPALVIEVINLLKPTGNTQQLYVLPYTVFMCYVFI
jgi:hypothetical protein